MKKIIPSFIKQFLKKIYYNVIFITEFISFSKKADKRFSILWKNRCPQLLDKTPTTLFDAHYIYHPAWAIRILVETKPAKHIDISSILYFSTMASAFLPVEFYDYRPANVKLDNFISKEGDLMKLPFDSDSVESLSCMHTIEHIGLGRYGDPIDPDGDIKAMKELIRVLAPKGNFLFVVPIGKPMVQFNAHRIYSYNQIMDYFKDLTLKEFSLIPDDGQKKGIIKNASEDLANSQRYACGCFWFTKN